MVTGTTPSRASGKIFGLSITEQVEWGVAHAVKGNLVGEIEKGVLPDIPTGNLPHHPGKFVDIENLIRTRLVELQRTRPDLFEDVTGIGVSTIGVVSRRRLLLENVPRKNWKKPNHNHIISFRSLFLEPLKDGAILFPTVNDWSQIVVQNDASARCLTESIYRSEKSDIAQSLLYLMIGEGVNGAISYRGDLLEMERHSEMGHCLPQLDLADVGFDDRHSGCPSHTTCFEGVASTARIRREWGQEISDLPHDHPAWDLLTSYIAQFITIGVVTLNPKLVLLGGNTFTGESGIKLIDRIRSRFLQWNANYLPDYKDIKSVRKLVERAQFGNGVKILSALTIGCLAAFPGDRKKTIAEKQAETAEVIRLDDRRPAKSEVLPK